jgi:Cu/Ag efflux pump CusA
MALATPRTRAKIGGMVSSTLLTLIVIPAIYAVVKGVAIRMPALAPSLQRF